MIQIIPGILEKDIHELERKIALVAPYAEWIQLDVEDNTLFPNETFHNFLALAPVIEKYNKMGKKFEAHLMVSDPQQYLQQLEIARFSRVIAHVESTTPREFLAEARSCEYEVGMAIDADTDFEVIEPFLEELDSVLVMTVDAGASGTMFQPETVEKIRIINRNLPDLPVEVDGGMNEETVKLVKEAGATRLVSTSYIFKNLSDVGAAIQRLQNA